MTKNKVKKEAKDQQENEEPELTVVQEEPEETEKEPRKDTVEEKLEKAELELLELKDRHIRLQAEFDNYRKRTLKERMELLKTANESLLVSILPVIDDFDRAVLTLDMGDDEGHIKEGVKLIYTKFQEFLKQNGIKEINAFEQNFDTDLHEAITKIPAPSKNLKGKIVDVVQKGYYLNDKVIRFSKVVIGE